MTMGKYVRILNEVEAVRATETNIEELKKIASGVKKVTPECYSSSYYRIVGLPIVLWVGQWLLKHPSGRLEIKSDWEFRNEYEPK